MDRMTGNVSAGFEGIAQMLLEQKKVMDALEAENRDLRRQLEELRQGGSGVSVIIGGKTFSLVPSTGGDQGKGLAEKARVAETQGSERRDGNTPRNPLTDSYVL
jgi:hypothetical protein